MKSDDKWLEVLRHRLEECSVEPSDDLWTKLESELDAFPVRPARIVPLWLKATAAAAVIVLIGGGAWMYVSRPLSQIDQKSFSAQDAQPEAADKQDVSSLKTLVANNHIAAARPIASRRTAIHNVQRTPVKEEAMQEETLLAVNSVNAVDTNTVAMVNAASNTSEEMASARPEEIKQVQKSSSAVKGTPKNWYDAISDNDRKEMAENAMGNQSLKTNRWAVSLTAMNGLPSVGGNTGDGNVALSGMSDAPVNLRPFGNSLSGEYAASDQPLSDKQAVVRPAPSVKHKIPVSYGVSVRYNLTEKWGIESGLSYTLLNSSFSNEGMDQGSSYEQKLHYVEVPVRVSYTILNQRWFATYVALGTGVAKCVYAKVDETNGQERSLGEKPWQLSVGGAVGAQLNIVEHVGIYLEPGIGYYFNDNSSLRTVYKDHPWVFKLNFGFRLTY